MNLSTQCKNFHVVIGANNVVNVLDKADKLITLGCGYTAILHDRDSDYIHFHFILCFDKRIRASTVLNRLCEVFDTNFENIQIEQCLSVTAGIQYLVHKNAPNKYQYDYNDIFTSYTRTYINNLINSHVNYAEITTQTLLTAVFNCTSRLELIQNIGISAYSYYRNTINDIINSNGLAY